MPYVSHRWLGGLLTNFSTIENRIQRMHELRKLKEEGQLGLLPTKERMGMERELEKLEINLGGVSTMTRLPDAVFVADPKREAIATKEVNKLGLPLIGLVDTNCDPDEVDYLIPGNDDAIRSCSLIVKTLVRAVEEGRAEVPGVRLPRCGSGAGRRRRLRPRGARGREAGGEGGARFSRLPGSAAAVRRPSRRAGAPGPVRWRQPSVRQRTGGGPAAGRDAARQPAGAGEAPERSAARGRSGSRAGGYSGREPRSRPATEPGDTREEA